MRRRELNGTEESVDLSVQQDARARAGLAEWDVTDVESHCKMPGSMYAPMLSPNDPCASIVASGVGYENLALDSKEQEVRGFLSVEQP